MNPKRVWFLFVVLAIAACACSQSPVDTAQNTEELVLGTTSPDLLLMRGDVRDDLNLSSEQSIKILTIQNTFQDQTQQQTTATPATTEEQPTNNDDAFLALRKYTIQQYNSVLTPEQLRRLKQISLQLTGYSALNWADVQKQIDLPRELQLKIADLTNDEHLANESVLDKFIAGGLAPEQLPEIIKKNHQILNDEIAKVLPDTVKEKFKTLGGRMFKVSDVPRQ